MEYSIRQVSEIAGISARTLRYYDSIGLLKPAGIRESGYRYYGEAELETLQQILFYRERGLKLEQIAEIIQGRDFDIMRALHEHLEELEKQQIRINSMIITVKKTIASMKGEITMSNQEKFEAFKKEIVEKNEAGYGQEIREKYGDKEVDRANQKMLNMTESQYQKFKSLEEEILESLARAVNTDADPEGQIGREITRSHKEWLQMTWSVYTPQAHKGIVQMYTADPRFTEYYNKETTGCAEFLKKAVEHWSEKI